MVAALSRKDLYVNFGHLGILAFVRGKHQFMIKGSQKIRIPNPHVGDISASLVKEITPPSKHII